MLLETIRCEGGVPLHLSYHQQRLDETLSALGIAQTFDLKSLIRPPDSEVYRCRFLYDSTACRIEFHPYASRIVSSLKLIRADTLEYPYKYADRSELDRLYALRSGCDDVAIVKNGFLTDTTIANIALLIEGVWVTPLHPLLRGTTRARLLDAGFLTAAPLRAEEIDKASRVAVMNAMMGFVEVENGIIA